MSCGSGSLSPVAMVMAAFWRDLGWMPTLWRRMWDTVSSQLLQENCADTAVPAHAGLGACRVCTVGLVEWCADSSTASSPTEEWSVRLQCAL